METSLRNETRDVVIHDSPEWALTFWQQFRGFMFSKPGNRCIIFLFMPTRRAMLHMWFVFGPIDVIVLDGTGRVVALKEKFRPWTTWNSLAEGSAVLELPVGTIAKTGTVIGDQVRIPPPPIK